MRNIADKIIGTIGNSGLFARDQDVFVPDSSVPISLVKPGQPVAWNPITGKSIDNTDIAGGLKVFEFGRGWNHNRNAGFSTEIRSLGSIDVRNIEYLNASGPACGQDDVWQVWFSGATIDKGAALVVQVFDEDSQTQLQGWNNGEIFSFPATITSGDCNSCSQADKEKLLACAIVNKTKTPSEPYMTPISDKGTQYPFHVGRAYALPYKKYCFTPSSSSCNVCDRITGIKSFTIGDDTYVLGTDIGASIIVDTQYTHTGMLDYLAELINTAMGNDGHAIVLGREGCCPKTLLINSCKTFVLTAHDDSTIASCGDGPAPLTNIEIASLCVGCDAGSPEILNTVAGITVISKSPILDPYEALHNGKRNLARRLKVWLTGPGTECMKVKIIHVQSAKSPFSSGYEWAEAEYYADVNGEYDNWNTFHGIAGRELPYIWSKMLNMQINPRYEYSSINLGVRDHYAQGSAIAISASPTKILTVAIPDLDSTTKTQLLTFWNAVLTAWGGASKYSSAPVFGTLTFAAPSLAPAGLPAGSPADLQAGGMVGDSEEV